MEYQHRTLMLPGIILMCLFILPAAGAALVLECPESLFCPPQQQSPLSLDALYSQGTSSPLLEETALNAAQGDPGLSGSGTSPKGSFAEGRMSAWVNQHSMYGNAQGVVSEFEYHQMVTASGQIQGFHFSASWVSS